MAAAAGADATTPSGNVAVCGLAADGVAQENGGSRNALLFGVLKGADDCVDLALGASFGAAVTRAGGVVTVSAATATCTRAVPQRRTRAPRRSGAPASTDGWGRTARRTVS